jgi:hypothetical protein
MLIAQANRRSIMGKWCELRRRVEHAGLDAALLHRVLLRAARHPNRIGRHDDSPGLDLPQTGALARRSRYAKRTSVQGALHARSHTRNRGETFVTQRVGQRRIFRGEGGNFDVGFGLRSVCRTVHKLNRAVLRDDVKHGAAARVSTQCSASRSYHDRNDDRMLHAHQIDHQWRYRIAVCDEPRAGNRALKRDLLTDFSPHRGLLKASEFHCFDCRRFGDPQAADERSIGNVPVTRSASTHGSLPSCAFSGYELARDALIRSYGRYELSS